MQVVGFSVSESQLVVAFDPIQYRYPGGSFQAMNHCNYPWDGIDVRDRVVIETPEVPTKPFLVILVLNQNWRENGIFWGELHRFNDT